MAHPGGREIWAYVIPVGAALVAEVVPVTLLNVWLEARHEEDA